MVEAAHRALTVQFKEMHIPEWWRWKWLAPPPKKQDPIPALNDLRPLVLLEALIVYAYIERCMVVYAYMATCTTMYTYIATRTTVYVYKESGQKISNKFCNK